MLCQRRKERTNPEGEVEGEDERADVRAGERKTLGGDHVLELGERSLQHGKSVKRMGEFLWG